MRVEPPERWSGRASMAVIVWLLSIHPRELKKAADICVISINNETIDWRGAVSPRTENMVTDMKLETKRPSARPIALTAAFVVVSVMATDGFAFDATQNPHPTDFGFVVNRSNVAGAAESLESSGIPNCGNGNALASNGGGFYCMTPARGATGATGSQGPQGPQGPAGSSASASCHVGSVCVVNNGDTTWSCTQVCVP